MDTAATCAHDEEAERQFALQLIALIEQTFFSAYYMRAQHGMTETELLIDYDIDAANAGVDKYLANTCRRTIRSACKAVEENVPFHPARAYLRKQLDVRVARILNERKRSHAVDQNTEA